MYRHIKRGIDLGGATLGILVLSPVLAAIAWRIHRESPGPLLYRGRRVGLKGVPFDMLKFRTMVVDADKIGGSSTPEDDPRITRIGKMLRRHKLDELPQLLNILRGEMSFVGPRPQVQWAVDRYTDEERKVLDVLPGITDWASLRFRHEAEILKGSSDPDRDYMIKIHPEKMRLALDYVKRQSLFVDLKIIVSTAALLLGLGSKETA